PLGKRDTPAITRLPVASTNAPALLTLKPVGSAESVINVPLNGLDGRPAEPTRFETLKALKSCAVASSLTRSFSCNTQDTCRSCEINESPNLMSSATSGTNGSSCLRGLLLPAKSRL